MKTVRFTCPHCGQKFEAQKESLTPNFACTQCGVEFRVPSSADQGWKWSLLALLVMAVFVVRAVKNSRSATLEKAQHEAFLKTVNPDYGLDAWQIKRRMEAQAEQSMLETCSNYIGFQRIVSHYLMRSDDNVTNWKGEADIDFVNKVGGIERTNLIFRVYKFQHDAMCGIDEEAMWKRQEEEGDRVQRFRASLER